MKRMTAILFASAAFVVPAGSALAADSAEPAGYECNIFNALASDLFDTLSGHEITGNVGQYVEPAVCGDNKNGSFS